MHRNQIRFIFLNVGHFVDHLFMLISVSVAALQLNSEWSISYAALRCFWGLYHFCRMNRRQTEPQRDDGVIFFIGIGASSMLTGMANSPLQIAACLTPVGIFASIYHPLGIAMVAWSFKKKGIPLAINGIFGNMGVVCAALPTGFLIDDLSWRGAFTVPGGLSIVLGLFYLFFLLTERQSDVEARGTVTPSEQAESASILINLLLGVFGVIFFTTAIGGLVFQSTTFAFPKVFGERLADLAVTATTVGGYAFLVFSMAALAQLVIGYLVDNYSVRTVFAVVAFLQAIFFSIMTQLSGIAALPVAIAFMVVVFGQIPLNDVLVGRMLHSECHSRAYALRYIVTFSVMALMVPLIGWIHGEWSFSRPFSILAVAALLIFVAFLLLSKSKNTL